MLATHRKKIRDGTTEEVFYAKYKEAATILKRAIKVAKARCWNELMGTLERDPWGHPYRRVRFGQNPNKNRIAQPRST